MNKLIVGFDMDGVVANTNDILANALSKHIGKPVHWQDWSSYDHFRHYGVDLDEFLDLCIQSRSLELAEPMPGIREAMHRLNEEGFATAVITARDFHPQGEALTRQWLSAQGIEVDQMHLVHPSHSKVDAMALMPGMIAYLEDHVGHLERSRDAGHPARLFLRDQPWNQHCKDFQRVHSVTEYVDHVLSMDLDAVTVPKTTRFKP